MTIQEIANQLIQLCESGQFDEAYNSLFAKDAISVEPDGTTAKGLTAILKKSEAFKDDVIFAACEMGEPQFVGSYFAIVETFHSVIRQTGEQKQMKEIGVYKVEDEQIVEERFFY